MYASTWNTPNKPNNKPSWVLALDLYGLSFLSSMCLCFYGSYIFHTCSISSPPNLTRHTLGGPYYQKLRSPHPCSRVRETENRRRKQRFMRICLTLSVASEDSKTEGPVCVIFWFAFFVFDMQSARARLNTGMCDFKTWKDKCHLSTFSIKSFFSKPFKIGYAQIETMSKARAIKFS